MVADALSGDRIIGMVLLRPGYEATTTAGRRSIRVGCAGVITHAERLADGRYNIVLRGIEKFRITARTTAAPYRVGQVDADPGADQPTRDSALIARRAAPRSRRCSCPQPSNARRRAEASAVDARRGSGQRAGPVSRSRAGREAGAARARRPPRSAAGR